MEELRKYYNIEVSNYGRVKTKRKGIHLGHVHSGGYRVVKYNNGSLKQQFIHILVATLFLKKLDGCVVNHKDGNKENNRVSNLEWVTQRENVLHTYDNEINKARNKIKIIDTDTNKCYTFNSQTMCAKFLKIADSTLCKHLKNGIYNNYKLEVIK